jgi:hypothetical protein
MRNKKAIAFFAPLIFVLVSGCTPPMPPDVLAAIAEQEVTCIPGEVKVAVDAETSPLIQSAIDLYITSCELSTVTLVQDSADADIVIFDNTAAVTSRIFLVPHVAVPNNLSPEPSTCHPKPPQDQTKQDPAPSNGHRRRASRR